jgi:hypothetical protein
LLQSKATHNRVRLVRGLSVVLLVAAAAPAAAAHLARSPAARAGSPCRVFPANGSRLSDTDSALACRFAPRLVFTPGEAFEERDASIALAPACDDGRKEPAKLRVFRRPRHLWWRQAREIPFLTEHPTLQDLVEALDTVRKSWPPPPFDGLLTIDEPGKSTDRSLHRENEQRILSGRVDCASPSSREARLEQPASSPPYPRTVYVHIAHGPALDALEYWFFYYYDAWRLPGGLYQIHEGDWEHVTVLLARQAHNGPDADRPVGVQYAWHKDSSTLAWPEVERCSDPCALPSGPAPAPPNDEHPVVFVGLGSHASYPFRDTWFPSMILMAHTEGADVATGRSVSPAARLVALGADDPAFVPDLPVKDEGRQHVAQFMWGERGSRLPYVDEIHGSGPLSPQKQGDKFADPSKTTAGAEPLVSLFGGSGICTTSGRAIAAWWGGPAALDPNASLYRLGAFESSEVITSGATGGDHYLTSYDMKPKRMSVDDANKRLACATPPEAQTLRLTQLLLSLHDKPDDLATGDAWAWQVHFPRRDEPVGAPPATAVAPVTLLYCYRHEWLRAVFNGVPRDAQDAVLQGTPAQPALGIDANGDGVVDAGGIQSPLSLARVRRLPVLNHSC